MILINMGGGRLIPVPTPNKDGDDGGNLGPFAVVLAILCIIGTILIINS